MIDATKPYRGGNDVIWQIHNLNNIDKHRFLLTTGSAFRAVNLKPMLETHGRGVRYTDAAGVEKMTGRDVTFPDLWLKPANRMFPLVVGKELPSFTIDPDKKMEFRFDVAFGERGIVEGDALLETLQQMVDTVEALLPAFVAPLS